MACSQELPTYLVGGLFFLQSVRDLDEGIPLNNSLFWDDKYCEGRKLVKGLLLFVNKLVMTLIRSLDWIRVLVDWLFFVMFAPLLYVLLYLELSQRGTAFEAIVPIMVVAGWLVWSVGRYLKRQVARRLENVKREWNQ